MAPKRKQKSKPGPKPRAGVTSRSRGVKLTDAEHARVLERARKNGMNFSDYVRAALEAFAPANSSNKIA